jgi:hypothetical protein
MGSINTSNSVSSTSSEQTPALDTVDIRMKRQQKQLLLLALLCAISLPSALLALALVFTNSETAALKDSGDSAEVRDVQKRLSELEMQYAALLSSTSQAKEEVAVLARTVGTLDITDERNATFRVQQLLVRQEHEFQQFLATLEGGLYNLHMMIPHSRGWWDAYKADLMVNVEQSKAREMLAGSLLEIEPLGITQ